MTDFKYNYDGDDFNEDLDITPPKHDDEWSLLTPYVLKSGFLDEFLNKEYPEHAKNHKMIMDAISNTFSEHFFPNIKCGVCGNKAIQRLTNVCVLHPITQREIWFTNVPAKQCTCESCGQTGVYPSEHQVIINVFDYYTENNEEIPHIIPFPLTK
ncbi:hypothetical protein D3C73_804990 [compost metagenome]